MLDTILSFIADALTVRQADVGNTNPTVWTDGDIQLFKCAGVVTFTAACTCAASSDRIVIGTIPEGYRPKADFYLQLQSGGAFIIGSNGDVAIEGTIAKTHYETTTYVSERVL